MEESRMKPSRSKSVLNIFALLALLLSSLGVTPVHAAGIRYAAPAASGASDCSSWANACTLQTALTGSTAGDEIWVAAGLHMPTTVATDRVAAFQLKSGVAVYGGFAGTESARGERDFDANVTILSGDIDNNDTNTDGNFIAETTLDIKGSNSYHVVVGSGTDNTAILDGFIITAGQANGSYPDSNGGGMINNGCNPMLANLTFSGNSASGGAGMNNHSSNPTLTNITFKNNASLVGGGMMNYISNPVMTNVVFDGNNADIGGGMSNENSDPVLIQVIFNGNQVTSTGGGIYNFSGSVPTLTDVTFDANHAENGGGAVANIDSDPAFTNVTFSNNSAGYGGGMYSYLSSPVLNQILFDNNSAVFAGGGIFNESSSPTLTYVTFINNSANSSGGLHNYDSHPALVNVIFVNNSATTNGGGMVNYASNPTIEDVVFSGNNAENGGAIYNEVSHPTLEKVTFVNNAANDGGGIYNFYYSNPTLTNVTFSGNSASHDGGGIYNTSNSVPLLTNVTLSGNSATHSGGGLFNTNGAPILVNVVIANSTNGGDCVNGTGGSIDATSSHNLIEDDTQACGLTGSVNGNIVGLDPNLGPLQNNGGYTETFALMAGSPAIDSGTNTGCPSNDQRGLTRPQDGICDIGAYEAPDSKSPTILSIVRSHPNPTSAASVNFTVAFSEPVIGVDMDDFTLVKTGDITDAVITAVNGSGAIHTVTVSTGAGVGTLKLETANDASAVDMLGNPLTGLPYTGGQIYSVRIQTFQDIPTNYWAWNFIERLYINGITGGCGGGNYCPNSTVTRAQMAVFLLVAEHGSGYTPSPASGIFYEVPASNGFAKWIEQLSAEGITGGCGNGNYCPNTPVTREQMAVFLLVAEHGTGYTPPAATGVFADVPADNPIAKWVEALAAEGITGGCGGGKFCPKGTVTRAQMAVFLVAAFNLP
jgi:predicted outer membrane repeat protein